MNAILASESIWPTSWRYVMGGAVLFVVGAGLGHALAKDGLFPGRWMAWWVARVVMPLATARRLVVRAVGIFTNNALILSALVATGTSYLFGLAAVAMAGVCLGAGFHAMAHAIPAAWSVEQDDEADGDAPRRPLSVGLGFLLNMLEPPAIAVALGLTLAREPMGIDPTHVWTVFGVWVLPALFLAAIGEGLWLGYVCRPGR